MNAPVPTDSQLLRQAGERAQLLLQSLSRDLMELQRHAQTGDPLHADAAAQAEAGLALYRAAIDAALRVAENLDPHGELRPPG